MNYDRKVALIRGTRGQRSISYSSYSCRELFVRNMNGATPDRDFACYLIYKLHTIRIGTLRITLNTRHFLNESMDAYICSQLLLLCIPYAKCKSYNS